MDNYQAEELIKYIKKFKDKKIMVLGDLIADKFIIADPERLSREAPVLILKHQQEKILLVVLMQQLTLQVWELRLICWEL